MQRAAITATALLLLLLFNVAAAQIQLPQQYVLPSGERMFYNYIVAGAGTAGCALAARLSENPAVSVLLIGNGDVATNSPFTVITLATTLPNIPSSGVSRLADPLQTIEGLATGRVPQMEQVPHVFGGGSEINGAIFLRVANEDYDNLLPEYGINGWNSTYMTKMWAKIENFIADGGVPAPADAYVGGDIDVRAVQPDYFLGGIMNGLLQVTGAQYNSDFGSGNVSGVGPFLRSLGGVLNASLSSGGYVRQGSYEKYILPIISNRPNLRVIYNAEVLSVGTSILCRASGMVCIDQVNYVRNGVYTTVTVIPGGEVVLSAGAFGTAKIMMHSGLGNCGSLAQGNVPCRLSLPGLGAAVKEQFSVIAPIFVIPGASPDLAEHLGAVIGGYVSANRSDDQLNVELFFNAVPYGPYTLVLSGTGINRPYSTGTLDLSGVDWSLPLNYSSGVFTNALDIAPVVTGYKLLRAAVAAFTANTGIFVIEESPGLALVPNNDAAITAWIMSNIGLSWHVSATTSMGVCGQNNTVVDDHLCVCGAKGLRIADGGVFPDQYRAHSYHSGALMIAERAAEIIRGVF